MCFVPEYNEKFCSYFSVTKCQCRRGEIKGSRGHLKKRLPRFHVPAVPRTCLPTFRPVHRAFLASLWQSVPHVHCHKPHQCPVHVVWIGSKCREIGSRCLATVGDCRALCGAIVLADNRGHSPSRRMPAKLWAVV